MRISTKLVYKNNWESDEYYVGDKLVTELTQVKIKDKIYNVTANDVMVPYNDMGHQYSACSTHYFVTEKVFGLPTEIDLNTIVRRISVHATKFKVKE